ncbi:hypothetical protein SEUCBS140593_000904 [Sporothrix eucalyptigena]|uniref:Uncharacterized protein n=1 Tax=Sporothrix eucalyptigena TaxID=1812306 RepID=A0ABP0ATR3_9PEZI
MPLEHPLEFHAPGWHDEGNTPVVNGFYIDRVTGKPVAAPDSDHHQEYMGPPCVDIIVTSIHEDTTQCVFRAARPFPMNALLCHIVSNVVGRRDLEVDSLMATPFAIRVTLAHPLTTEEFSEISMEMANGIWDHPPEVEKKETKEENYIKGPTEAERQ